jgi:tetratricopeptide (TPR) repeat protein
MRRMVADVFCIAGLAVAIATGTASLIWSGSEARAQGVRTSSALAEIVSVKGDEDALLVGTESWQPALVAQGLIGGDRLRTGDFGGAALLFRDRTHIRMHANSQLRLASDSDARSRTVFGLDFGQVWGRAIRPEDRLIFETPTATAAVRGTDWSLVVGPDGATRVLVFEGVVDLSNPLGTISVGAGEAGVARPGEPPVKEFIIRSPEAAQWALRIDIDWMDVLPVLPDDSSGSRAEEALPAAGYRDPGESGAAKAGRLAEMAQVGLLIEENRFDTASARLRSIEARTPGHDWRPGALRVWLDAYAGDLDTALAEVRRLRLDHPGVARLATLEAVVLTLRGEYAAALVSGRDGVALDRGDYLAHHWVGVPAMQAEPTPDIAREAFEAALALKPDHVDSLTRLALIDYLQGDYLDAKALRQSAIALAPLDPDAVSGLVESLVEEERVDEARALIDRLAEDPLGRSASVYQARAYVAYAEGRLNKGVEDALSSLAISPGYPGSGTALGIGLYEKGEFDAARSAFETAARLDPNDPLAPYYESLVAQAQWDADGAIAASRETVERLREGAGGLALADTVGVRDGQANVNVGYRMLGLDGWADYFLAQARSPYSANSLFDESFNSQNSTDYANAARIGILLDPMAFSIPNRYIAFVRAPVTYNTIRASVGGGDGLFDTGAFWQMSGFRRDPLPFAFLLHAESSYGEDLNIDRSQSSLGSGLIGLGFRPTSKDFVAASLNFEFEDPAAPGVDDDRDESASARWLQGHVGWQRRYALDDRLAMNLTFDLRKDERTNGDALFDGFSDLDASLYGKFQQASQVIFDTPLYDFSTEVLNAYLCRYVSRSICRRTCRRFYRSLKATSRSLNLSWIQFRASRGTRKTLKFRSAGFALMAASTGALVLRAATFTNGTTQS